MAEGILDWFRSCKGCQGTVAFYFHHPALRTQSTVHIIGFKVDKDDSFENNSNWPIIRPAITNSKTRFQLTTLEANVLITRMHKGKKVILPEFAMIIQARMSLAGDVECDK
jgi:hypothetical protein